MMRRRNPVGSIPGDITAVKAGATDAGAALAEALVPFVDRLPWPAILLDGNGLVIHLNKVMSLRDQGAIATGRPSLQTLFPEYFLALKGAVPWLDDQQADVVRQTPAGEVHERIWLRKLPQGACLIAVDQTRLHELEAGNAQTARLASLGFMLAGVCHEVSNPLAAIYSMVQILQSNPEMAPDILEKGLANIAANVKRILDVSKRLSDFSRVEDEPRTRFAMDDLIEETLVLLRQDRRYGAIEVEHRSDPGAVVLANAGQLQEVLLNILINAIQAMQGRGHLSIVTRRASAEQIEVAIRDSGPGIAPENLPRLFEPFFTTKPVGQGTGLGLSISNEIIHEHGGTIRVENNPDRGACFYVLLPLSEERL